MGVSTVSNGWWVCQGKSSEDNLNLIEMRDGLDKDHYGLDISKIGSLNLLRFTSQLKSAVRIVCLVGPPARANPLVPVLLAT